MYNGFADGLASQGKFQPMSLSPWRPDVTSFLLDVLYFLGGGEFRRWVFIYGRFVCMGLFACLLVCLFVCLLVCCLKVLCRHF